MYVYPFLLKKSYRRLHILLALVRRFKMVHKRIPGFVNFQITDAKFFSEVCLWYQTWINNLIRHFSTAEAGEAAVELSCWLTWKLSLTQLLLGMGKVAGLSQSQLSRNLFFSRSLFCFLKLISSEYLTFS